MRTVPLRAWVLFGVLLLLVAACTADDQGDSDVSENGDQDVAQTETARADEDSESTLARVRDRGELICGVNDAVPGFGFQNEEGEFSGFDVEFCRVIAAGVLGDADAVSFEPLTAEQRFTALQAGEIDVLVRNTTWTAGRDGTEGGTFLTTTFYDGQGMMVRDDSEFTELEDMQNTAICVLSGTTTELNLASRFADIPHEAVTFEDNDTLQAAFQEGRCDGWTSDKSQLAGVRSAWPEEDGGPEALRILDETFSKEPLGPVVQDGDSEWAQAVDWSVIATIQAEEFGINSDNVEDMQDSEDPEIRRFLGEPEKEGDPVFDPGLGLEPDFAVEIISQVGNYAEIYEEHVGPDTPLGLERGVNSLWTEEGLLYPPPYR